MLEVVNLAGRTLLNDLLPAPGQQRSKILENHRISYGIF
jgi:hypothetical protein